MQEKPNTKNRPDCLIIGGGIFGLWAGRHALQRGETVLLVERGKIGAGASGGFLGALMPHMPDRWNAKKQFQYQGLKTLESAIGALEADTGIDCGYRRCGRLMPLAHEGMLKHIKERTKGAGRYWVNDQGKAAFDYHHVRREDLPLFSSGENAHWLCPQTAPFGAAYDTLSARINPRATIAALVKFVRDHKNGRLAEEAEVAAIDPENLSAQLADGTKLSAGRIIIAAGWRAYDLLEPAKLAINGQVIKGRGVKGQAALLDFAHHDDLPILYDHGSYIVAHKANRIAIGSTSVDDWQGDDAEANATRFDEVDMGFYEHALELAPALRNAPIVERWANIRPRNTMADPVTGKISADPLIASPDGYEHIQLMLGSFKIGFGIAHIASLPH